MSLENVLSQEIVQKLGWTLLHFVWQATAVAVLLEGTLAILRKSSASVRYVIACLALGLMVVLPAATMPLIEVSTPSIAGAEPPPAPIVAPLQPVNEIPLAKVTDYEPPVSPESNNTPINIPWQQRLAKRLEPALPYLVTGWFLGVFGLSLWHLGGWAQLQRLRRKLTRPVDAALCAAMKHLMHKLGVCRAVELLESALVQVPTVVGWLRPMILLPASALTGLSAEQLQALLAHELAHVRRHDYLVNMLQTAIETLGFYHPAVWWVSHKIRIERENCCDDLAVTICGDRLCYARALTSMEEIRCSQPELAVAASGGNLLARIHRLVGKNSPDTSRTSWIPSVITILVIATIAIPSAIALSSKSAPQKPQQETPVPDDVRQTNVEAGKSIESDSSTESPQGQAPASSGPVVAESRETEVFGRVLQDGRNVVGARVIARICRDQLSTLSSQPPDTVMTTDENGSYRFADLPAGRYSVSVMSQKGNLNMAQKQINLEPGDRTELNFGDEEGFTLTGVVTANGETVEIASVRIQLPNESIKWGWTNHNGHFRITGIPRGRHSLFTTYDKDLDPVTFFWGKDGKREYDTLFDRRQITIENDLLVEIHLQDRSKKESQAVVSKSKSDEARSVKVELSVVEIPSDSKLDGKTIGEIKNLLGGKITVPESPAAGDLLRQACEAMAPGKDESAGDKRVTQEQFSKLFDLVVSRGYVKILLRPTLEVVEGQTAQIKIDRNSLEVLVHKVKDDAIDLQVQADLSSPVEADSNDQTLMFSARSFSTRAYINSGQSSVIGGLIRPRPRSDAESNAEASQRSGKELMCILTASITTPPTDAKSQDQAAGGSKEPIAQLDTAAETYAKESAERLAGIGQAMLAYAKDHDGKYPARAKLHELQQYLVTEEYAWPRQYEYLAEGKTTRDPADTVIYYDAPLFEQGKGTNVLFNDGRVEFVNPKRLNELNINKTQILIEMRILEVTDDFLKENRLDPNSVRTGEIRSVHPVAESAVEPNSTTYCLVFDDLDVNQLLEATAESKDATIVAAPQVLTSDGRLAVVSIIKDRLPVPVPSAPNSPSGKAESKPQYVDVGTSIKIVADALPDSNNILLNCEWEVSQVRDFVQRIGAGGKKQRVPVIDRYNTKTTATIPDAKTLLIGGKKIRRWVVTRTKRPLLGDLPLIGSLFRTESRLEETRNVLILIKPTVITQT